MISWAVRVAVIWGGIALLVAVIGSGVTLPIMQSGAPSQTGIAASPDGSPSDISAAASGFGGNSMTFRADRRGHVNIDGNVNGASVRFMLDTGATLVALTTSDASAAGFTRADLTAKTQVRTASGVVQVASVRLRELRVGQFTTRDVPAVVVDDLAISLLGQSFLKQLTGYEVRDGVLTLNWN